MKKASEDVFDQFFSCSIGLLCIADTNGKFIKLNPEWERTLGYPLSEMEGRNYIEFVHHDDVIKTIDATIQLAEKKQVHNFVNRYRHKNGSYRWIEWRSFPSDNRIFASALDITDRIEVEKALKQSEERNELITSLLTDYIFKFEVTEDDDLILVYASDNFERITGGTRSEDPDSNNWTEIFHADDYPRIMSFLRQIIGDRKPDEMECRTKVRNADRWIDIIAKPEADLITGRIISITGAIKDISKRKRAELKIRSSEEKFLKAFMCSPDLVSIIDPKTNKYVDVNEVFIHKTGYQRHEIIGKTPTEMGFWVDIRDRDKMLKLLAVDKHLKDFATKLRTRYGEVRDCLITADVIEVNNETNFLFFTRDITDEKRSAEALAKSEQKFSDFFYLSPNIIGVARLSDGKILDINSVHHELTGYAREEVIGRTTTELNIWVNTPEHNKIWEVLVNKGEIRSCELDIRTKGGTIIPCILSSKIITYNNELCGLFVLNDISKKKQTENALRESEQRLRSFIDKSSEGVVIINESGIVEEWNNSAESITGISKENMTNKFWGDSLILFNPHPRQSVRNRVQIKKKVAEALVTGEIDLQPHELMLFQTPTGKVKYLEEKMFTIKTDSGYRLAVIFTDITERREIEELIAQERNMLRALIDTVPDIIYVKDTASRFIITNKTLAGIINTQVDDILGKTDFDFFPADQAQRFFNDEQLLIQTGNPVLDKEEIIFDQDGKKIVLQTTKLPRYDNNGNITGIVGTGHIITERKQYEDALRHSEDLLKGITQNIPGVVYQFYADKEGKYGLNFVNDRSLDILGLDSKKLDTFFESFVACIVEEDRTRLMSSIQNAVATVSPWKYEGRFVKPDGTVKYFKGESQPRLLDNKLLFDGFLLDTTQSWMAEQELAYTRAILATALSQTPIPMLIVSMPDYIIRIANKASIEILGIDDDSNFIGNSLKNIEQTWQDFDEYGNPVPFGEMPIFLALNGIETKNKEFFIKRKDGTIRWESVSSSVVRNSKDEIIAAFLVFPDITDRKRTEEVLVEKDAKIRSIFSAAPVAIGLTINREFQECNDTFYKMTGFSAEEIIGKSTIMLYPTAEEFLYVGTEQYNQMKENRIDNLETRWLCKNGRIINILLRFVPLDFSDFTKGITFSALDISDRKEAEAEIVKLNEKLERKVRERTIKLNEAISDLEAFAYSVSHDLRAPIRHIDGFVKLMYLKIPDPSDSIVAYYNKIDAATKRMSSMIDSLLSFSRVGRKELAISEVALDSLVYEIIDHHNPDIGKRDISWNISALPNLHCDKNLIKLVFENLISNAIKYTSKKSNAIIEIGSVKRSDDRIELYIKDNGVGFSMAHASNLFGVFQRLHPTEEFEGIGVGLANVKQIIEKHKGSVRAEGKTNEGAVFYITLPKK